MQNRETPQPKMPQPVVEALQEDFHREHKLVNLIIRGCIEHRWALGDEERAIAQAMVFNAFEAYLVERGMAVHEAGEFCERHLDRLMSDVLSCL